MCWPSVRPWPWQWPLPLQWPLLHLWHVVAALAEGVGGAGGGACPPLQLPYTPVVMLLLLLALCVLLLLLAPPESLTGPAGVPIEWPFAGRLVVVLVGLPRVPLLHQHQHHKTLHQLHDPAVVRDVRVTFIYGIYIYHM